MLKKRTGFTLIELLVVIAIIAILAAILFPIFAQAKATAKISGCTANLRQIYTALVAYNDDWNGKMPDCMPIGACQRTNMNMDPVPIASYVPPQVSIVLRNYAGKNKLVWRCPGDLMIPPMSGGSFIYPNPSLASICDYARFGLSYQWDFSGQQDPKDRLIDNRLYGPDPNRPAPPEYYMINQKPISYFPKPGKKQIARDAVQFHKNSNGANSENWDKKDGASNFLFLDGHVKLVHGDAYGDIR